MKLSLVGMPSLHHLPKNIESPIGALLKECQSTERLFIFKARIYYINLILNLRVIEKD
jgi:hypothetical protein